MHYKDILLLILCVYSVLGDGGVGTSLKGLFDFACLWRAQIMLSSAGVWPGVFGTSTDPAALSPRAWNHMGQVHTDRLHSMDKETGAWDGSVAYTDHTPRKCET